MGRNEIRGTMDSLGNYRLSLMISALFSYLPLLWIWFPDFAQGNEIIVNRRILFPFACLKKIT